jgi:PKD domain-containing protein/peptidase M28-like protein
MSARGFFLACAVAAASLCTAVTAAAQQPRPVVDTDYLYHQLYYMSSNYLYRVSGEDGDPGNPADPANQPPLLNGWQEFYAYWKQQMTSTDAMGPLGADTTIADHYFQSGTLFGVPGTAPPFDSDVAEVTIPGATCPGQRVLLAAHPDSTPGLNQHNGSAYDDTSGVTMGMAELSGLLHWYAANHTWPARTIKVGLFDAEETGLYGSQYYADNLIPDGPQGQYVLVANMDQNGMEYPAFHLGTSHYTSDPTGGSGPWRTNINASPLKENDIYTGDDWKRIQANMPAIQHFRDALDQSVSEAFDVLGRQHGFKVPLENPVENGATAPAYSQADRLKYSPVQDDTLGRTDQVPFVARGIPGFGVLGAYDSNDQENPYPNSVPLPLKPPIDQYAGYDTPRDTIQHLNLMTSGQALGEPGSDELRDALELPATWTSYLVSRPEYGGASARPSAPIAYFETDPVNPAGLHVSFDGSFSRAVAGGGPLRYAWSFGDGSHATGVRVSHTYSKKGFEDVQLVVRDKRGRVGTYRQAVAVGGDTSNPPATAACGHMSTQTANRVLRANKLPVVRRRTRH